MALTVGELNAIIRLDDGGFVRALDVAGAKFTEFRNKIDVQLAQLDRAFKDMAAEVKITADTKLAERDVKAFIRRMGALKISINVNVGIAAALARLQQIEDRVREIGALSASITVRADTGDTLAALRAIRDLVRRIDGSRPSVTVNANTARAEAALRRVDMAQADVGRSGGLLGRLGSILSSIGSAAGGAAGSLSSLASSAALIGAAVPAVAGLVAMLAQIAPAAAVAATGVFAIGQAISVVKIGTSGISGALKAAFAPAVSGGGSAAKAAGQAANALQAVKDATQAAAEANRRASQQIADDERNLTDAQQAAKRAQADLNGVRQQAVRDLEDLNDQLADAHLDERGAADDVTAALDALNQARQHGTGPGTDMDALQLAYDRSVQKLKEAQEQTQRLTTDTAAANKAGVDGSKSMVDARQQIADANRAVADQERALAEARRQQALTEQQGLESIRKAQQSVGAAAGGASGGVNQLAAAMARLSPNARAFVNQVIALKPAWDALKRSVQDKLFENLAVSLKSTASSVLPVLRTGLISTAGALNLMGLGVLSAASGLAKDGTLGKAMGSASAGLHNLSGIPGIVVKALGQVAAAAGPAFDKLTGAAGRGAAAIGSALNNAFKSGAMGKAIDQAIGLIKELGSIAGNVFSIIGSVMGAAQVSGGGFLGVIKDISGALAGAFKSPEIQGALHALFETMAVIGRTVAPLLVQALKVIAPVLTALAPPVQRLVKALGKSLSPIISALKPVLMAAAGAIGDLFDAIDPLLPMVGDLISKFGPVLTPVLKLIGNLFKDLGPVLQHLAGKLFPPLVGLLKDGAKAFEKLSPVISKAVDSLGSRGLTPILDGLVDVFKDVAQNGLSQFLSALKLMLPVVPKLMPYFEQLGKSIGQVLEAVAPLIPQLTTMGTQLALQLLPALLPLVPPLTTLAVLFLRLATAVLTKIVVPAIGLIIKIMQGLRHAFQPAVDAVKWVTSQIAHLFEWLADHLVGHSVIPDMIRNIVSWFASLPGKAWNALSGFASRVSDRAWDAAARMVNAVKTGIGNAVSWLSGLPYRAWQALGDLGGYLYSSGKALIQGFIDGIVHMAGPAGDAVSSVLGFVKDHFPNSPAKRGPFSGKGWTMYSGIAVASDFAAGLAAQQGKVGSVASALMASAQGGIGALAAPGDPLTRSPRYARGFGGGVDVKITPLRVLVDVTGNDRATVTALRKKVRVSGGNVQATFGQKGS